jgi:hypothetical protein
MSLRRKKGLTRNDRRINPLNRRASAVLLKLKKGLNVMALSKVNAALLATIVASMANEATPYHMVTEAEAAKAGQGRTCRNQRGNSRW